MTNLNKTEKAVAGVITVAVLFFLIQIIRWLIKR